MGLKKKNQDTLPSLNWNLQMNNFSEKFSAESPLIDPFS